MKNLNCVLGRKIVAAEEIYDYVQLKFDNSTILNIYCLFDINGSTENISKVVGDAVSEVVDLKELIWLKLISGCIIRMRYGDNDYDGPEAIQLIDPNGQIVIWP